MALRFEGPAGDLGITQSSSPRGPLERKEEDTMGCCSGRCTLAFICGMQLVSDADDPLSGVGWRGGD